jgi:hypothetical protein
MKICFQASFRDVSTSSVPLTSQQLLQVLTRIRSGLFLSFMKSRPVGTELFHADGKTNLIDAFLNFANESRNCYQERISKRFK